MSRRISSALLAGLLICLFAFGSIFVRPLHAQIQVTDDLIMEQNVTVHMRLAETLREYLKLVQLITIERLQQQVAELEARLAAQ